MLTDGEMLMTAMTQSAYDTGAEASDFTRAENVIVSPKNDPRAKVFFTDPPACNLVSYGKNVVASVKDEYRDEVGRYIGGAAWYSCFETPYMHRLDDAMRKLGQRVCFMAEYWLPEADRLKRLECWYEMRLLMPEDFSGLYTPEWHNALCADRRERDVLAVGAYDGGKLIGLAGCSADCEDMLQIGVDVLPEYRRRGTASALTSRLALEIMDMGKVPFYCCAWSNIPSARNAYRSGFRPAWVELTVRDEAFAEKISH